MENIQNITRNLTQWAQILLLGWFQVFKRAAVFIKEKFSRLTLIQMVYFIACIGLLTSVMLPWVTYEITLIQHETVSLGSRFRVWAFFPIGILGLVNGFVSYRFRREIFYMLGLIVAITYGLGLFFPGPIIHTSISVPGDFQFAPAIFAYGPMLGIMLAISHLAYAPEALIIPGKLLSQITSVPPALVEIDGLPVTKKTTRKSPGVKKTVKKKVKKVVKKTKKKVH